MTRRQRRQQVDPRPGLPAMYRTDCPRCEKVIKQGDRIAYQRGHYIHVGCAAGADDE